MVNIQKLKKLARKKDIKLTLVERRKQLSGVGVIWDFDVSGGRINRLKIVESRKPTQKHANIYYGQSSKSGTEFKTEAELLKFMEKYK